MEVSTISIGKAVFEDAKVPVERGGFGNEKTRLQWQFQRRYHQEKVGTLSLSADGKVCTFEYDNQWLASGFSISPLELPLKPDLFIAKATPFNGNFGIFEDSLPDGYGRYLFIKPC